MSPFDYDIHFKLFGYYWNAGFKFKGKAHMPGWYRVWFFYFTTPMKASRHE